MPFSVLWLFIVNGAMLLIFAIFALFIYPKRELSDET